LDIGVLGYIGTL